MGSSSRSCSKTSPIGRVKRCKQYVSFKRQKWLLSHQDSDLGIGVSAAQNRKSSGNEDRPCRQFADGEWDKLVRRMISGLVISKHQMFKCSNILQAGVLMRRKKGGGVGTHFRNEPENHLMLVNMVLAGNQLCLCVAVKRLDSEQDVSSDGSGPGEALASTVG